MTCIDMVEGEKEIFIYYLFYLIVIWPVWTTEVMEFELTVRFWSMLRHLNLDTDKQAH